MKEFKIVIPARYGSSRFPGKPLADICGKPMIWHTYQRALETEVNVSNIIIATDDVRILEVAENFGAKVVMTSKHHESGTERLAEVARLLNWSANDIVVNLQGDEPLLAPELITLTANTLSDSNTGIATLACPISSMADVVNPNIVKVICNSRQEAIYFSRSTVPFARDGLEEAFLTQLRAPWFRHIGMYAYKVQTLFDYLEWPVSQLEELEKLEQLRAIFHGIGIKVAIINKAPEHGVDTPEDLKKVIAKLKLAQDLVT